MNKLFTKIATFAIGAFMAVGVGVAASVSGPEASVAHATTGTEITFNLGTNGSESHADGSGATTYQETVNGYNLSITNGSNMYTGARDAKGNSCIKFGTSSKTGSMSFTVPNDVASVILAVGKYKANTTKITVNGTAYTLTKNSNDGAYDDITVDTSSTKTVSFTTVSGGYRAMLNTITFVAGSGDSGEGETPTISVTDVALNQYEATLEIGQTVNLTATVSPVDATNPTVTWSSSDEAVASVDNNGVVTAKSKGTANITATADGITSTACVVTVNEAPAVEGEETASVTIENYADANSWANATKYTSIDVASIDVDSKITATVIGGSNTGKYYEDGENWRIYQSESATLTITVSGNYEIKTVNITYTVDNKGTLKLDDTDIESGTIVPVNAKDVTFSVGNTGSATNGQVRVTAIEVVYYPVEERIPTKLSAEWNQGKGTYYNSDNNNIFSTADLVVKSLTAEDKEVETFLGGTGFKVSFNETTLDATSEVQSLDVATMTAGEYPLTVTIGELTPATLTINIVNKDTTSLQWKNAQEDTFVSYIDALELKFTVTATYNDGSGAVSDKNITAVLYEGNSNEGRQICSLNRPYTSYSDGYKVKADDGILADNTINRRLAYAEPQTFFLEVYVTDYPAIKLEKVLNVGMPTMEVSDANDFNYYVGTEYELAANARLVSGDKVRELDADEFTLDKETVTPTNIDDITVTATFDDNTALRADYTITPKTPVTIDSIEVYDNDGNPATDVVFTAGEEFKLFNAAGKDYFLYASDSGSNEVLVNTYADITFALADDANGTNSQPLEDGDTMFRGMNDKYVIVTYTQGAYSASTSYTLTINAATAIAYEAPTTGGVGDKVSSIDVGDIVYLVCESKTVELNDFEGTSYGIGTGYTGKPSGLYPLTVCQGSADGTYALKNETNYLCWTGSNSLKTSTTLNNNSSWNVSFDNDGNAIISNAAENARKLQWNASSPRFACYTSTQTAVQLYGSTSTLGNGVDYIQSVIDTFRLNSTLQNEYGLSICNKDSGIYASEHWTIAKEVYEGLSKADKDFLSSEHDKYAADEKVTYAKTMDMLIANDPSTSQLFGVAVLKGKSSDVILVVTLISITATVLVVGYVLNKKRVSNSK